MSDYLSAATAADGEGLKNLVMAVIGTSGTGKSSLCDTFAGKAHDDEGFPVDNTGRRPKPDEVPPTPTTCTNKTTLKTIDWMGDAERPVHLIDTPGMKHGAGNYDLAEVENCLKKVGHVNVFLVVIDGSSPRLDGSLIAILRAYQELFGERFLETNGVLAVTNWPKVGNIPERGGAFELLASRAGAKEATVRDLATLTEGLKSDELNKGFKELGFIEVNAVIPVVFIDAQYNPADERQKEKLEGFWLWDKPALSCKEKGGKTAIGGTEASVPGASALPHQQLQLQQPTAPIEIQDNSENDSVDDSEHRPPSHKDESNRLEHATAVALALEMCHKMEIRDNSNLPQSRKTDESNERHGRAHIQAGNTDESNGTHQVHDTGDMGAGGASAESENQTVNVGARATNVHIDTSRNDGIMYIGFRG